MSIQSTLAMTCLTLHALLVVGNVLAEEQPAATIEDVESNYYDDVKAQFVMTLPDGWFAFDQSALFGMPQPHGVIVFSQIDLGALAFIEPGADESVTMNAFVDTDTGKVPSFIVDRYASNKGNLCVSGFSKKEQKRVLNDFKDMARGPERGRDVAAPTVENVMVGECQGLRLRTASTGTSGPWEFLAYATTDGQTNYAFVLRTKQEFFESNLPYFESSMSTLQMSAARNE